jgi:DNA (cytosine-5)-methyltransferase 1
MRLLSLFSGMAGMDAGFSEQVVVRRESVPESYVDAPADTPGFVALKRLPFTTVFQNDILPAAKTVAALNNWAHNYHMGDIRDLLKNAYAFPAADVITGGFPCQDFSHAGKRQGFDAQRGTLYQSYVELVRRVKPVVFVAENVEGLLTMPGEPIKQIIADFGAAGYEVKYQLIKCEEFGIPQSRHRVIIMGIRLDRRPGLPTEWNVISENRRRTPLRDYFAHLQEPGDSTDPAQQVYSKAARLEKGQGQSEVNLAGAGPTMRAEHHGNIEFRRLKPSRNNEAAELPERRLTVREAALIQTFPPECRLTEERVTTIAYKPIGNAVPPLLGYLVARKVQEILSASQPS